MSLLLADASLGAFLIAGVEPDGRLRLTRSVGDGEGDGADDGLDNDGDIRLPFAGVYKIGLTLRFASPSAGAGVVVLLEGKRGESVLAGPNGEIALSGEVTIGTPPGGIGFALIGGSHELDNPTSVGWPSPRGGPGFLGYAIVSYVGLGDGGPAN